MLAYHPNGVLAPFPEQNIQLFGTSSHGNSTYLPRCHILVDLGFPKHVYLDYDPLFFYKITHVLLTHRHSDHLNTATFKYVYNTYPHLIFVMSADIAETLQITNETRCIINHQPIKFHQPCCDLTTKYCHIIGIPLHHDDVINRGYYITNLNTHTKYLYATDFNHVDDLLNQNVNIALLEANYDPEKLQAIQDDLLSPSGLLAHGKGCLRHLSEPQAWQYVNQHVTKLFIPMHSSKIFGTLNQSEERNDNIHE